MSDHHDNPNKASAPGSRILYAGQARAAAVQLAAGRYGDDVAAVFRVWRVGKALLTVVAVLVELGAWKPGGWTGYYRDLERRASLSEKTVRRVMKALRAVGLVEGGPLEAYHDDNGQWLRDRGTYRLVLPRWVTARYWRPGARDADVSAGPPTGHGRPDSRVVTQNVTYTDPEPVARAPVDDPPRAPLPASYVAAAARLRRNRRRR